jgi:hypothetical protein
MSANIMHLPAAARTRAFHRKITARVVMALAAVAAAVAVPHQIVIAIVVPVVIVNLGLAGLFAATLLAGRHLVKAGAAKSADEKATAAAHTVTSRVLPTLENMSPGIESLVVVVFNLAGHKRVQRGVFFSWCTADGTLHGGRANSIDTDWVFEAVPSPMDTSTDWRVAVLSWRAGQTAVGKLMTEEQMDPIVAELDLPAGELFRSLH